MLIFSSEVFGKEVGLEVDVVYSSFYLLIVHVDLSSGVYHDTKVQVFLYF